MICGFWFVLGVYLLPFLGLGVGCIEGVFSPLFGVIFGYGFNPMRLFLAGGIRKYGNCFVGLFSHKQCGFYHHWFIFVSGFFNAGQCFLMQGSDYPCFFIYL